MISVINAESLRREVKTQEGTLTILQDINFELKQGESVAIQGASGSGKSTLLGLLAGLDLPQAGTVVVDGVDITRLDEDQRAALRAKKVGFVFQSFYLVDDLTALENVALPLELLGNREAISTAKHWLQKLGLANRAGHFPKQLSGGEQQRVALSRAFAVKPALLFADEPTANLDAVTAATVLDQLFALQRESNTSMVIATHDDALAQRCDRRVYLHGGRTVRAA